jgi:F-type H+-transporting ATPase subunit b
METLKKLLEQLGIEPGALLVNMVGFGVLVWLMKRYLFTQVGGFIQGRREHVTKVLDEAEADRQQAQAEKDAIESRRTELLQAVETEAATAREQAARDAEDLRKAARARARDIERAAQSTAEREQEQAARELRQDAAVHAADMCRRILQGTLTQERHQALLDQFIADVERMAGEQPAS